MEQVLSVQGEITFAELMKHRCKVIKEIFNFFEKLKSVTTNEYTEIINYIELIISTLKPRFSEFSTDSNFQQSFDGVVNQPLINEIPPIKCTNFFITVERRIVVKQLRKVLEYWIEEANKSGDMHSKEFLNAILEQCCLPDIRTLDNQLVADVKELQTFIHRPDINVTELLLVHMGLTASKDVIYNSAELIEQVNLRLLILIPNVNLNINQADFEFNKFLEVNDNELKKYLDTLLEATQDVDQNNNQDITRDTTQNVNQDEFDLNMLLEVDDIEFQKLSNVDKIDFSMLLEADL